MIIINYYYAIGMGIRVFLSIFFHQKFFLICLNIILGNEYNKNILNGQNSYNLLCF